MGRAWFNVGMLVGAMLSAAFVWWVVSDCTTKAGDGYCAVTIGSDWKTGVLHFEPRP